MLSPIILQLHFVNINLNVLLGIHLRVCLINDFFDRRGCVGKSPGLSTFKHQKELKIFYNRRLIKKINDLKQGAIALGRSTRRNRFF
jgi:hypothetical protein